MRLSQRLGTTGASSCRRGQDSSTTGAAQASVAKSCAACPIRISGDGSPANIRIGRLSHGPGSHTGGQTPSASPPSTSKSTLCNLASSKPQMNTRGCSARSGPKPRRARRLRTT